MVSMDDVRRAYARAIGHDDRQLPVQFREHVERSESGGTAATGIVIGDAIRSDDDLLRTAGLDPDAWEVVPGAKRVWSKSRDGSRSIFFAFRRRGADDDTARWLASRIDPIKPAIAADEADGAPLFVALADLQIGKAHERLGGTPELVARCEAVLADLAAVCGREHPRELVIADLGDICEGTSSHTSQSQAAANDIPQAEQLRVAARILMQYIVTLAPLCGRTTVAAVRSNHGEERLADGKTNGAGDWGLMAAGIVADAFDLIGSGTQVEFRLQDALEAGVRVQLGGMQVALTHGHYAKRISRMGDWVASQAGGMRPSVFDDCPVVVHGHFHHFTAQSSRGRLILGCPAMESGSDWVAKASGEYADPGVLTFRERGGRLADLRIFTPPTT